MWDLHTGTCRQVLQGHAGRINSLGVSADGKWCVTGSEDCTARIWDLRRGLCSRVLTVSEWAGVWADGVAGRIASSACCPYLQCSVREPTLPPQLPPIFS